MKQSVVLILLLSVLTSWAAELREIHIEQVQEQAFVVLNPFEAVLIVYTTLSEMSFESNMGINSVDVPFAGEYRVHLIPGTHIITYKSPGFKSESRRINIQPKNYKEVRIVPKKPLARIFHQSDFHSIFN